MQADQDVGQEFVFIIAAIIGMAFIGIAYAGWNTDWSWLFLGLILFAAVLTNSFMSRRFQGSRK